MNFRHVEESRAAFDRDGYLLVPAVFRGEQLARLVDAFDQIVDQLTADPVKNNARWSGPGMDDIDGGRSVILHTHNVQSYAASWMHALLDPAFLDPTEAILGPDILLHHTKLFYKPPLDGAPFPMHQDWEYFPTERDRMIAAVIHLSDATEDNGCLRVYPGSHHRGRLPGMKGEGDGYRPREEFSLAGATPVTANAGDVLFFSYLTVHGSGQNLGHEERKTVLVQMYPGDDRVVAGNKHSNVKLVLRGKNHFASRFSVGGIR